jgi:transcriptional regulator with XRE-family HTH domain
MTNADIGKNIQRVRLDRNVLPNDLCILINKSEQWLYDRETGNAIIELKDFIDIANALEVSGRAFFCLPPADSGCE